jgi:chromate transport protein ChrA
MANEKGHIQVLAAVGMTCAAAFLNFEFHPIKLLIVAGLFGAIAVKAQNIPDE